MMTMCGFHVRSFLRSVLRSASGQDLERALVLAVRVLGQIVGPTCSFTIYSTLFHPPGTHTV